MCTCSHTNVNILISVWNCAEIIMKTSHHADYVNDWILWKLCEYSWGIILTGLQMASLYCTYVQLIMVVHWNTDIESNVFTFLTDAGNIWEWDHFNLMWVYTVCVPYNNSKVKEIPHAKNRIIDSLWMRQRDKLLTIMGHFKSESLK